LQSSDRSLPLPTLSEPFCGGAIESNRCSNCGLRRSAPCDPDELGWANRATRRRGHAIAEFAWRRFCSSCRLRWCRRSRVIRAGAGAHRAEAPSCWLGWSLVFATSPWRLRRFALPELAAKNELP